MRYIISLLGLMPILKLNCLLRLLSMLVVNKSILISSVHSFLTHIFDRLKACCWIRLLWVAHLNYLLLYLCCICARIPLCWQLTGQGHSTTWLIYTWVSFFLGLAAHPISWLLWVLLESIIAVHRTTWRIDTLRRDLVRRLHDAARLLIVVALLRLVCL